jgi:hypothetical protein
MSGAPASPGEVPFTPIEAAEPISEAEGNFYFLSLYF